MATPTHSRDGWRRTVGCWASAALCDPAHAVLRSAAGRASCSQLSSVRSVGAARREPGNRDAKSCSPCPSSPASETPGRNRAQAESEYGTDAFRRVILPVLFHFWLSRGSLGSSCAGLRLLTLAAMMTMAMGGRGGKGNGVACSLTRMRHFGPYCLPVWVPRSPFPAARHCVLAQEEAEPGWQSSLPLFLFVSLSPLLVSRFHDRLARGGGATARWTDWLPD